MKRNRLGATVIAALACVAALAAPAPAAVDRHPLPDPDHLPTNLLFEPGGDLRFLTGLEGGGSSIGRLTPGGALTLEPAGFHGFGPTRSAMARSSDGALWMAEVYGGGLERRAPDGTWKSGSYPETYGFNAMVTGPDGAVYSTNHSESVVRHFVDDFGGLSGTSFDSAINPAHGNSAYGLAFLDGRMYLMGNSRCTTEDDCVAARLVEIDPAAAPGEQRREIPIPALDYLTNFPSIVAGPDGRLWVQDQLRPRTIHRFTPAGADAPLTLPAGVRLGALGPGPAGSVLAVTDIGAVAHVRPDGSLKEWCPLDPELAERGSGHDYLLEAVTGPGGAIWFSSRGGIGRVTLDTPPNAGCAPEVESTTAQAQGTADDPAMHLSAEIVRGGGRLPSTFEAADPEIPGHGVRFEIGKTTAYGRTVPVPSSYGTQSGTYALTLDDLEAGQTYHARAVVTTRFGTVAGPDTVFTTPPPPAVEITAERIENGFPAIDVTIDPLGSATSVDIEYGPTAALGTTLRETTLSPDGGKQSVTILMDGGSYDIRSQPEFHYRLIATNGRGATTTAVRKIVVPPRTPTTPDGGTPQPGGGVIFHPVPTGGGGGGETASPAPAPGPAAGAADETGPTLRVPAANRSVQVTRSGVVRLTIGPADEDTTGNLGIKTAAKVRSAPGKRRRVVALGAASFQALDGQTTAVRLKLSKANQRLLRRLKRLKVRATITLRDARGNATIRTQTITLKAPVRATQRARAARA